MGEVAIAASPHEGDYIRFLFAMSSDIYSLFIRHSPPACILEIAPLITLICHRRSRYTAQSKFLRGIVSEVGILIIDDDIASQRSLKLVLDSEGWSVRIVDQPSHAMAELATGAWDLAIVNVALLDLQGPVFVTLRELVQADVGAPSQADPSQEADHRSKRFRALFLVPLMGSKEVPLLLESEGLPYSFKPYHLHDFLQKVSELLLESGAIAEPLRGVEGFASKKRNRDGRSRDAHSSKKMFASREDYQMTEEELAEFERQEREEAERKKRDKQVLNRDTL
jgi:hypothetical protein